LSRSCRRKFFAIINGSKHDRHQWLSVVNAPKPVWCAIDTRLRCDRKRLPPPRSAGSIAPQPNFPFVAAPESKHQMFLSLLRAFQQLFSVDICTT
jgi:hypothetical protein